MFNLPVEYALIKFEGMAVSGEIVTDLVALAERGIVRYVDIVFIQKDEDGHTITVELNDLEPELYEVFVPMGQHVSGLFTNEDLEIAANKLDSGASAMLILWENLWVFDLRQAILNADGELLERGQITPEVIAEYEARFAAE